MLRRLIVALAIAVLATSGCGGDTDRVEPDLSGTPKCQDIWVDGKTLPQDYEGCVVESGDLVMSSLLACADGSQFTTHEDEFFAQLGGTITAGPGTAPKTAAAYSRALADCHQAPRPKSAGGPASTADKGPKRPPREENFETFAGNIFTVSLVDTRSNAAQVRFCATAPYEGGSIPVTRSPWGMQDQDGTVWPADEGDDVDLRGSAYPVEASVSVGDCLQGWIPFDLPASTTPVRVVYDSDIGGPFTWDLTSAGASTLPDPPAPEAVVPPSEPVELQPQRDCFTLESAATPFSGNWLTLESRGQFTDETVRLQDRLNWLGFGCIPEDGDYGPVTREAVMRFQRALGLVVDGNVGPQTWEAVFSY